LHVFFLILLPNFYDRTRKEWPFNTGDCLIEVTSWVGLTVYQIQIDEKAVKENARVKV